MTKYYHSVNGWLLEPASGSIFHIKNGERKRLGEYQIKLLDTLIQHAGQILSREELTQLVWEKRVIGNNSLPNAIHALRAALEDDGKQQLVIKTIPKRGYVLDAAYYTRSEYSADEEHRASSVFLGPKEEGDPAVKTLHSLLAETTALAERAALETAAHHPATIKNTDFITPLDLSAPSPYQCERGVKKPCCWWRVPANKMVLWLLLLIAASSWAAVFVLKHVSTSIPKLQLVEQERGVYSHIRIFELTTINGDPQEQNKDRVYNKLEEAFQKIHPQLEASNNLLNVYYRLSEQNLSYTFSIEHECEKQQLAMTIYHWRINSQLLNDLIYREMERKLNEMAPCIN